MARSQVSDDQLRELGTFQGKIERNANFRQQAFGHNLGRNVRIVKLLAYVGLLRRAGKPLAGQVDCIAAVRQNFSSSQDGTHMGLPEGPMQAAHFMPGQVTIGGLPVWNYTSDLATRGQIEFLFAEVEHLPAVFNQADTAAEAKGGPGGLCAALVKACQMMISGPETDGANIPTRLGISISLLESAYQQWQLNAPLAFQSAMDSKASKPVLPPLVGDRFSGYTPGSIDARANAGQSVWNRDLSVRVLDYYLEDQGQRSWAWVLGSCQTALHDVHSGFKA